MNRRSLTLKILVFLLVSTPPFADASIADWLDKLESLSGPGPFLGRAIGVDYLCRELHWENEPKLPKALNPALVAALENVAAKVSDKTIRDNTLREFLTSRNTPGAKPRSSVEPNIDRPLLAALLDATAIPAPGLDARAEREAVEATVKHFPWRQREAVLEEGGRPAEPSVFLPFCTGELRQPRLNFGALFGFYSTDKLPTSYHYNVEKIALSPEIHAIAFGPSFDMTVPGFDRRLKIGRPRQRFLRSLEVGATVGKIVFYGDRFSSFSLWFAEVPRVTLRPLAFLACKSSCPGHWTRWDLLELQVLGRWIDSVDSEQFGAEPGKLSEQHFHWSLRGGLSFKLNR